MMRICLLSTTYPPGNNEGISRQRRDLANELSRLGHDVHVITCGAERNNRTEGKVKIHEIPVCPSPVCGDNMPVSNMCLNNSQALFNGLDELLKHQKIDIIDVPLWAAQGFVTTERCHRIPVVTWLQTTTAQMLKINRVNPSDDMLNLVALEKRSISRSAGILGDSHAVIEAVAAHYGIPESTPTGMAHIGTTPAGMTKAEKNKAGVDLLIVGRLEKRKGTPLMFKIIPKLLDKHPELRIRFVGRDNSESDGWQDEHNATYPGYFKKHHPYLASSVIFEGYVDEEILQEHYTNADILVVPSEFESFGIIYLEAMRMGIPVATLKNGGAEEIFPDGENDGALLAENGDALLKALEKLADHRELRDALGDNGLKNFKNRFTVSHMAETTIRFYEEVLQKNNIPATAKKVYQVMEHVSEFDGVSKIVRAHSKRLTEIGQPPHIVCQSAYEQIKDITLPLQHMLNENNPGIIYHYWNYKPTTWILHSTRARKALYYHNITPAHFFDQNIHIKHNSQLGFRQLCQITDHFDLLIGDSEYNIDQLSEFITEPKPSIHIYPVISPEQYSNAPCDHNLAEGIRKQNAAIFLFVGRVAQNKKFEKVMAVFDYYYRNINSNAILWLPGSSKWNYSYRQQLEELRVKLKSYERILFTDSVTDLQLEAFYRTASVFISGSEHEGFGIPLIEAMAHDVPVIAYAAGAVPETMGDGGILIKEWDIPRIAGLVNMIITDKEFRDKIIETQRNNLKRFNEEESRKRLNATVEFLTSGKNSDLFRQIKPGQAPK